MRKHRCDKQLGAALRFGVFIKTGKTYSEQLKILRDRHLGIENDEEAILYLSNMNYYNLSGYFYKFQDDEDNFTDGFSLEDIINIYKFDNELKNVIFQIISTIEHTLRTKIAYRIAMENVDNPLLYLTKDLYKDTISFSRLFRIVYGAIEKNKKLEFVSHHIENCNYEFPIWVIVELLTLGDLEYLYDNLKNELKNDIAAEFDTDRKILKDWIFNLRILRNIVAHSGRLYGFNMRYRPQKCPNGHCSYYPETGKVFDQLYMLKIMHFDILEWQYCISRINEIIENYSKCISLSEIGFPEDWLKKLES